MKRKLTYLCSSLLAMMVLLISVGLSFNSIDCADTTEDSCCAAEVITCCEIEVTDECCFEEELSLQFDFDTPVEKGLEAPGFLPLFTEVLYGVVARCKQQQTIAWVYDLPPPKTTLENLSFLQVYRL